MNGWTDPGPRSARRFGRDAALLAQPVGGSGFINRLHVAFEAGPRAAASARSALRELDGELAGHLLDDVRLLVSELVTNSVRHSGLRPDDRVELQVQVDPSTVRVEVADRGAGFDVKRRDDDRTRPGGWGLYLLDELADRWGVARDDRNRVWFEMDQCAVAA